MEYRTSLRRVLALGVAVLGLLLSSFATTASASEGEPLHWAGGSRPAAYFVSYGTQQLFTAENLTDYQLAWTESGASERIACTHLNTSGSVENPTGGGAGVIQSASLGLSGCTVTTLPERCEVEKGTIPLGPFSSIGHEAGRDVISTTGAPTTFIINAKAGQHCALTGNYYIQGQLVAVEDAGGEGYYDIKAQGKGLSVGGFPGATFVGTIVLKTPEGSTVTESSTTTPGVPHWFIGHSKWTVFSPDQTVHYRTARSASVSISGELVGGKVEIGCGGAGTGLAGTVGNRPEGGWGEMYAEQLTLTNCVVKKPGPGKCTVSPTLTSTSLEATPWEEPNGTPMVELRPWLATEPLITVTLHKDGSAKCFPEGTYNLTGYWQADSLGDGSFELSGYEQKFGFNKGVTSGRLFLESEAGEPLRLQP